LSNSRDSVVGVVSTLRSGKSEVPIPPRTKNLFLIQSLKTHSGSHTHAIHCLYFRG